jgi:hypothetical protein
MIIVLQMKEEVILISLDDAKAVHVPIEDAVFRMYYLEVRLPTEEELLDNNISASITSIIDRISKQKKYIPLYDIYTSNIYIINARNVYYRVAKNNYRFPDQIIMKNVKTEFEKNKRRLDKVDIPKAKVLERTIRKAKLMIEFMSNFNIELMYSAYLNVFYKYSPEIGNLTYTCKRKSFIPHTGHLNPYYTKDEIIKLGMNQGIVMIPKDMNYIDFKEQLSENNFMELCDKVVDNDISSDTLIEHHGHIVKNDCLGIVQYYTAQGSYLMNQYMRKKTQYLERNEFMEENIGKIWKLTLDSPSFKNNHIFYRFVDTDDYLKYLRVGDIHIEKGFISTTRDPFYRHDLYEFGFILIKIKIPKNIKGIGLCLELLSHFPSEEEIILPPRAKLKLNNIDSNCEYYHPDDDFQHKIKKRYEFIWIENLPIEFEERQITKSPESVIQEIDFIELNKKESISLKERIKLFINKYVNVMGIIKCSIGGELFPTICESYDGTGIYGKLYGLKISNGFSMYSIYDGYMLFFIEIGEVNENNQMRVNYLNKYSQFERKNIISEKKFLEFISSVSYYFDTYDVILYSDYIGCSTLKKYVSLEQRQYSSNKGNNDQNEKFIQNNDDALLSEHIGGSYCVDYYNYLKFGKKKYDNSGTLNIELRPLFSYYDLDILRKTSPVKILSKRDRDEIYQIYIRSYIILGEDKNNLADFYTWMMENSCYLSDILVEKFGRMFGKDNPFKKDMYIIDPMAYLYNRGFVSVYNRNIQFNIDENRSGHNLPKNRYRIVR